MRRIALMAVGDDGWQGGIQYIINIINALDVIGEKEAIEVHLFRNEFQNFPDIDKFQRITIKIHSVKEEFPSFSFLNRIKWLFQRKLWGRINPRIENIVLKNKIDYVFPITLSDCNGKLNAGAWIADFQYHHFPDLANPDITKLAYDTISKIASQGKKIVLSSEFCEKDCFQLFPVAKGKTHVMPFAVYINKAIFDFKNFDRVKDKYNLPEKYLLVSNIFGPPKNHKTLFEALGVLKKEGIVIPLVCTGNIHYYAKPDFANEVLNMITINGIRNQVHLLGLIPRADQITMFRMAVAMVQPSVSEGWSTCVEEAKCLGKTLILSDIEVHREQYPSNPYFFEPFNATNLANIIKGVWTSTSSHSFPELLQEQSAYNEYQKFVKAFGKRFLEIADAS